MASTEELKSKTQMTPVDLFLKTALAPEEQEHGQHHTYI